MGTIEGRTPSRRGLLKWGSAAAVAGAGVALAGQAANAAEPATPTKFAPLPVGAKPLPVGPEGYRLDKVGPEMYAVTAGGTQAAFVVSSKGVIVIDAPPSLADALPAAIKKVTSRPVTHLIYSHHHADHIANAGAFGRVTRIAHAETARLIKGERDPQRPLPTQTFTDRYTLTVGDQRLELSYPGVNHEAGNIIIHAPRQRTAVMIDVVMPGWAPFRAWGTADSVPGVLRAHDELAKLDIDTFIGGHVHRLGTREDIRVSREFVHDLWNHTTEAIAATPMGGFFGMVEAGNNWAGFRLWLEAVADKVEPIIQRKWLSRLGAVDVFTRENIITVALSHVVDAPRDL
ncbi:MBL fold metallo-hydrolase [Kribbella sandramycini]|uniref:Glyoxylase-like metal-dependent hydrolase (Beta-lactamase superfamily II) n=1 Tax=Kribbella sandramycini TaxID=60450 RepID=A0A7Y4L3X6_9ACTN|nr:MBL fold metallo-hydrolase [Kribbella sandramycini]MBB6566609.1 glyoxylase-like metal-dependent hydrolase (beta-lactamase superfamily II) [Kribbella sandramycini]NOL42736.1 MBL fold metallo-hydrolase [Kribbella sandramycini]